jgi:hypothetical protein
VNNYLNTFYLFKIDISSEIVLYWDTFTGNLVFPEIVKFDKLEDVC